MSIKVDHFLNSLKSGSEVLTISNTGAIAVAKGTTAQRPGSPQTGMLRFNTSSDELEVYKGAGWTDVSGDAVSSSGDAVVFAIVFGS